MPQDAGSSQMKVERLHVFTSGCSSARGGAFFFASK